MNEVNFVGNVVKEPEEIETKNGKMGKLRIAVNTKRGEKEETLFIDVKLFGNTYSDMEYFGFEKGDKVIARGRLVMEEYTSKNEQNMRDYVVYATSVMKIQKKFVKSSF